MDNHSHKIRLIEKHIKSYADFPKKGVLFRDIFSVLREPDIFRELRDVLIETVRKITPPVECVVALDSRGFLFGPLISLELNVPFIPIRKKGKLPGEVISAEYALEYGKDTLQIQQGSLDGGKRTLIVDDLLATGGTLSASCELVEKSGGLISACLVIMELEDLKGREKVPFEIISLIKY